MKLDEAFAIIQRKAGRQGYLDSREEEFGVHSHDISDLSFGGLSILDNIGEIGVDS